MGGTARSTAHRLRKLFTFGSVPVFLAANFIWPGFLGMALGFAGALMAMATGSMLFRRHATPEDIRLDIEDRVRNPP
jgi:hypothetical protein